MKNLLLLAATLLCLAACEGPNLVIYNGCAGTWVRVRDGDGQLLHDYIPYGQEEVVDLDTYAGSNVELIAVGFRLTNDEPAGADREYFYIPRSGGGGITNPQLRPWSITGLWTSDGYGCHQL